MITVEVDEEGNPKSAIGIDDMVEAQLMCFLEEYGVSRHDYVMRAMRAAYRCGWAQCSAKARQKAAEQGPLIGLTEHGDKVYAVPPPELDKQSRCTCPGPVDRVEAHYEGCPSYPGTKQRTSKATHERPTGGTDREWAEFIDRLSLMGESKIDCLTHIVAALRSDGSQRIEGARPASAPIEKAPCVTPCAICGTDPEYPPKSAPNAGQGGASMSNKDNMTRLLHLAALVTLTECVCSPDNQDECCPQHGRFATLQEAWDGGREYERALTKGQKK